MTSRRAPRATWTRRIGPTGSHASCATPPPAPRNTNQDGPAPILAKAYSADTGSIRLPG